MSLIKCEMFIEATALDEVLNEIYSVIRRIEEPVQKAFDALENAMTRMPDWGSSGLPIENRYQ